MMSIFNRRGIERISHPLLVAAAILSMLLSAASGCRPTAVATEEHTHKHTDSDEMPPLSTVTLNEGEKLQVVATTNIVADVVQQVGGNLIDLNTLMPVGTDPHTFEPTPQDMAAVADAHVVFTNGAGLEVFLDTLLASVCEDVTIVPVRERTRGPRW
jgi:ABC-type Zn uptake system ZnuABC Zn-binding protein ZnuA